MGVVDGNGGVDFRGEIGVDGWVNSLEVHPDLFISLYRYVSLFLRFYPSSKSGANSESLNHTVVKRTFFSIRYL